MEVHKQTWVDSQLTLGCTGVLVGHCRSLWGTAGQVGVLVSQMDAEQALWLLY